MVLYIWMALCHVTGRPAKTVPQDKLMLIRAPAHGKDCRNPSSGSKVCHSHVLPEYPGWGWDPGSGSESSMLSVFLHWPPASKCSPLSTHHVL